MKDIRQRIKGLPKEDKILEIEQEITNINLSSIAGRGPKSEEITKDTEKLQLLMPGLQELLKEIKENEESYQSVTKRKELIPFMYDRDINWFFNAKNIPAQKNLVMPTYEYFNEGVGKGTFEPIDFLNLLEKQYKDLMQNLERPFDVLNNLKSIPLTERERHTLYGFILKWFGGYPTENLDEQCNTVLKLIEKEFLNYPEHTSEKEVCSKDVNTQKKFAEIAAHLTATEEMKGIKVITPNMPQIQPQHNISGSHYLNKVAFDFEDLPSYIIQKAIIWRFENTRMFKDAEFYEWQNKLSGFLNSIPNEYRIKALTKGIEYGKKVYKYHLENECTNIQDCDLNQNWERKIALAENMLKSVLPSEAEPGTDKENSNEKNKEFTTARPVLAIHYLLEYAQVRNVDATEKARFIQFITGKETGAKTIQNTNIYKKIKSPLSSDEKTLTGDLQFVRTYFEKLGLTEISKSISNEISSRE